MISQAKIDLAVLLKLFQHGEANGEAKTPLEICNLFNVALPAHRITAALEELESRGEVVRKYDRYHEDDGLWRIRREGIQTIEKALLKPSSFIARLNSKGDAWLESAEAAEATLTKLKRYHPQDPALIFSNDPEAPATEVSVQPIQITNHFIPNNMMAVNPAVSVSPKITVRSHDDSKVNATMHGGTLDAKSYDRSKLDVEVASTFVEPLVNWQKWGTIASIIAIPLAILLWWLS